MQPSPFSRMLWKETRELLPLAVAIVLGSTSLQLVLALVSTSSQSETLTGFLSSIPAVLLAAFTVAAGAMMFAGEKEAETIDLLRRLPASPGFIARSKFAAAVLGTFLVAMMLIPITVMFVSWKGNPVDLAGGHWDWESLGTILVLAHLLLWGIFFSVLTGKVLRSIFLSVFATVIARTAYPYDSIILGFVLLVTYWLKTRWFHDLPLLSGMLPTFSVSVSFPRVTSFLPASIQDRGTPQSRESRRLLWLEFVRSQGILICLVAAFTFWGISLLGTEATLKEKLQPGEYLSAVSGPLLKMPVFLLTLGVLISGVSVFSSDQQQATYRFLSERGVTPGILFRCKLLVWGTVGLILPMVLFGSFLMYFETLWEMFQLHPHALNLVRGFVLMLCISFTAGLLTSLLFRSKFVAFGTSLIILFLCLTLNGVASPEPDAIPVILVPIPFIFLIAARYRLRDWLLERNRFRHWFGFNVVLGIPFSMCVISGPMYRVYSIPHVESQESQLTQQDLDKVTQEDRKFAIEVAIELRCLGEIPHEVRISGHPVHPMISSSEPWSAGNAYDEWYAPYSAAEHGWDKASQSERSWLDKNHFWLSNDRVLKKEADRLSFELFACSLNSIIPDTSRMMDLAYLHHLMGSRLESEGNLQESLKHHLRAIQIAGLIPRVPVFSDQHRTLTYVYQRCWETEFITAWSFRWIHAWSLHPQQTKESLADAIPRLVQAVQSLPAPGENSQRLAQALVSELSSDVDSIFWEKERARRIAALAIQREIQIGLTGKNLMVRGRAVNTPSENEHLKQMLSDRTLNAVKDYHEFLPENRHVSGGVDKIKTFGSMCPDLRYHYESRINRLQMLELCLALNAWRIENGSFPTTLQALVGPYFDELPSVNFASVSYFPTGLDGDLDLLATRLPRGPQLGVPVLRLPRDTPFLFSSSRGQPSFVSYEEERGRVLKMTPDMQWFVNTPRPVGVYQFSPFRFLILVPNDLIQVPVAE